MLRILEECKADLVNLRAIYFKSLSAPLYTSLPAHLAQPAAPPAAPLAAPPPAPQPCAQPTPLELPPQPITAPVPARSYPPSPSVETIEEVEQKQVYKPLRNVKQMRQKFGAARKVPSSQIPSFKNCLRWLAKFGGINICFSRDEEPDAWYTTMLNYKQKLY